MIFAINYNSIGFINTQYRCDCTTAHAGHFMLSPACTSPSAVSQQSSVRMSLLQEQRVFIVEHCLASSSYLTCQNVFRSTLPKYPVPNKSISSHLLNRFHHCRNCSPACNKRREISECVHRWIRWTFKNFNSLRLTNRTCVMNGFHDFSLFLYVTGPQWRAQGSFWYPSGEVNHIECYNLTKISGAPASFVSVLVTNAPLCCT
jgi:hypothetical protein